MNEFVGKAVGTHFRQQVSHAGRHMDAFVTCMHIKVGRFLWGVSRESGTTLG